MPKILLVDDHCEIRKLLKKMLLMTKTNCTITEADNGKTALKSIQKNKPDLILLDIIMPVMDGFELFKILKSDKKYTTIPIIFITAKYQLKDVIKGLELGAIDYLIKPIKFEMLQVLVMAHLKINEIEKTRAESGHRIIKDMVITYNHEINQPLTIILGYIEYFIDEIDKKDEKYEIFITIQEQVNRVVKILEKIRSIETIETKEYIPGVSTMIDLKLEKN